jgi:hypothetical protein
MEKIKQKLATINEALETLHDGIGLLDEQEHVIKREPSEKNEKIFLAMRDSVIQRFEYCTDLFFTK